ncbi:hypothetical protein LCGC14_2081540 [marine sediment metagenome]|uniref:HTH cro/C1-type domain-containing protein n=1 Tax=marine sediment metagenome TaxID=412755 RepID=A0A0F9HCG5_9ZZZZ
MAIIIPFYVRDRRAPMRHNKPMGREWIEDCLKHLGKTKSEFGKALGVPPPRITEIIQGTRRIQPGEVVPAARFLHLPVAVVLERASAEPENEPRLEHVPGLDPIYIKGEVRAGHWSQAQEFPADEQEHFYAPAPTHLYPGLYALRVVGPSMDIIFPDKTILMVAPLHEYFGPIETGLFVIAQRVHDGLFETTVKQLEIIDGRYWLWPKSTRPEFISPIEIPPPEDWDTQPPTAGVAEGIYIIAVVVGSYRSEIPS